MYTYPMKLKPYISETVWGGNRLVTEYGIDPQGRANCAEAWVCSAHPNGSSTVQNGAYACMRLDELYTRAPELFGRKAANKFPILVKFIDAQDDLSIQVHPRDTDEVLLPGEAGKTECWYILDAQPGAKLYLGFREEIAQEAFAQAIETQTLMEHVQAFEVKAGEFYFIPAGTLHAIGRGVLLAEVQQNSDTTYRVYDYGRLQNGAPRALHVAQALAATDLVPYVPQNPAEQANGLRELVRCAYFAVEEWNGAGEFEGTATEESFVSLLILQGDAVLSCAGEELPLTKGESVCIPAGAGKYQVKGDCRMLITTV